MRAAIIVSSDSGYKEIRKDLSGPIIRELLEQEGYKVIEQIILPDEKQQLSDKMKEICDKGTAEFIVTTGGTGFSERDCMPEATKEIIEKEVPGIPEAMRAYSIQLTKRAMLSRGVAGIRNKTLIINLPGSPKAVRECLSYILPDMKHGLEILIGKEHNCAR